MLQTAHYSHISYGTVASSSRTICGIKIYDISIYIPICVVVCAQCAREIASNQYATNRSANAYASCVRVSSSFQRWMPRKSNAKQHITQKHIHTHTLYWQRHDFEIARTRSHDIITLSRASAESSFWFSNPSRKTCFLQLHHGDAFHISLANRRMSLRGLCTWFTKHHYCVCNMAQHGRFLTYLLYSLMITSNPICVLTQISRFSSKLPFFF